MKATSPTSRAGRALAENFRLASRPGDQRKAAVGIVASGASGCPDGDHVATRP